MTDPTNDTQTNEPTETEGTTGEWWTPPKTRITPELLGILMDPIHRSRIATRQQSGKQLSYVEAYDIKATLIRFFGFGGFRVEVIESKIIDVRENGRQGQYASGSKQGQDKSPQAIATSTVRLTVYGIGPGGRDAVYTETAVGSNSGPDIGDICDNAIKSAASDALKRCAIYLGDQFGLSLYRDGSTDPLVRFMFEPEQQALLKAEVERRAQLAPPTVDPAAQQAVQRATGQGS